MRSLSSEELLIISGGYDATVGVDDLMLAGLSAQDAIAWLTFLKQLWDWIHPSHPADPPTPPPSPPSTPPPPPPDDGGGQPPYEDPPDEYPPYDPSDPSMPYEDYADAYDDYGDYYADSGS